MLNSPRLVRLGIALVAVPALLWIPPILFFCRVNGYVLDRLLLKAPGLYFVYFALSCFPIAALLVGQRIARRPELVTVGRGIMATAVVLGLAFLFVVAIPLAKKAREPKVAKNPTTPRPLEPLPGLAVFPGAEGFGSRTRAGRGGRIIEVTSLADHGSGSLRDALDQVGPRIVVFRVSGTIALEKQLFIAEPFVTVAGQTAPGDGICLKNCGLIIMTNDVLVQHLRIRPGNQGPIEPDDNDAVQLFGKHGRASGAWNVVLDHLSASWSEDECVSTWFAPHDLTISWCVISEALHRSRHHKGTHSAGLLIGNSSEHVSIHHNLLAHNSFRNPLIIDGGTHDIVNNVIYDWSDISTEIVDQDANSFLNIVGNYYQPGPSSRESPWDIVINSAQGRPKIFLEGNLDNVRSRSAGDNWQLVSFGFGGAPAGNQFRATERYPTPPITTWAAAEAHGRVLRDAGAAKPRRDEVDVRIILEVRNGTGHVIDSPAEVGGHPRLMSAAPPVDTDHDAMPDDWEIQQRLDPHSAGDAHEDQDADGYTNVEEYLHSLL